MKTKTVLVVVAVTALLFLFCDNSDRERDQAAEEMKKAAEQMADAGRKMSESLGDEFQDLADAMKKMGQAIGDEVDVEPVDFRELKELLPGRLAGMRRVGDPTGERTSVFGIKVSEASADYEGRRNASMSVKITDLGSVKGIGRIAKLGWAMADFERETDTGYERTFTYKGFKGHEEYDREQERGQIELIVADRFVVEIDADNIKDDTLMDALKDLDIDQLEDWKDHGVNI